jgi:hypothetical protein
MHKKKHYKFESIVPTFFVTFTFVKRLWDPLIKTLCVLYSQHLHLPANMKHFKFIHIVE